MQSISGQSSSSSLPSSELAYPVIHKERYVQKATLTPKESNRHLTKPKSNKDTPYRAELDKLAKAWTEMVVGFLIERNSPVPLSSSQGKINV